MRTLLLGASASTPEGQPAGMGGRGGRDGSFDTNMVVILAALLSALICALALNSIVRCALRCGARGGESAAARAGMKRRALREIPVAAYADGAGAEAGAECAICLGDFEGGDKVRVLPRCRHVFHVRCVDTWLSSHASCPTCRECLVDKNGKVRRLEPVGREPVVGSGS